MGLCEEVDTISQLFKIGLRTNNTTVYYVNFFFPFQNEILLFLFFMLMKMTQSFQSKYDKLGEEVFRYIGPPPLGLCYLITTSDTLAMTQIPWEDTLRILGIAMYPTIFQGMLKTYTNPHSEQHLGLIPWSSNQ